MNIDHYRSAERALWEAVGSQPTEQTLSLDRTRTTIRVQTVGQGTPVVFIHGASNAGTSWASLAARMPDFRCVLVDRPGCGLSARLDRSLLDMAALDSYADDFTADVLDAIEEPKAHVIGTSFGGYFALRAAAAHPERIDRLVTLSWSFGAPTISTPWFMRLLMQRPMRRLSTRIRPTEWMARAMLKQIGLRHAVESGRFGPVEMSWFLALLRDTDTMSNEIDSMPPIVTLRGFNDDTLLSPDVLSRVVAPSLFLWGTDDPMGGEEIARTFVSNLPNAELEMMPGAGHAPWMDDPDHVAARATKFLRPTEVGTPGTG